MSDQGQRSIPRGHHYLPVCYLRDFVDSDGLLWVFDRLKRQYRRQPPRTTAVVNDYYAYLDSKGIKRVDIEDGLAQIEGMYSEVLRKIAGRGELDFEDRGTLSIFVALLMTRVPGFEEELRNWYKQWLVSQVANWYLQAQGQAQRADAFGDLGFSLDELLAHISGDRLKVGLGRETRLKAVLRAALEAAKLFMSMNWLFLTCASITAFVTSDQPLALLGPFQPDGHDPDTAGLATPGVFKVIPLTSSLCLAVGGRGPALGYEKVDRKIVRTVNVQVATNCYRFVIGAHEKLVRRIVKVAGVNQADWEPRMVFPGRDNDT